MWKSEGILTTWKIRLIDKRVIDTLAFYLWRIGEKGDWGGGRDGENAFRNVARSMLLLTRMCHLDIFRSTRIEDKQCIPQTKRK